MAKKISRKERLSWIFVCYCAKNDSHGSEQRGSQTKSIKYIFNSVSSQMYEWCRCAARFWNRGIAECNFSHLGRRVKFPAVKIGRRVTIGYFPDQWLGLALKGTQLKGTLHQAPSPTKVKTFFGKELFIYFCLGNQSVIYN